MSRQIRWAWDLGLAGPDEVLDLPDLTDLAGCASLLIRLRVQPGHLKDAAQVAFVAELAGVPYSVAHIGEEPTGASWAEECWANLVEGAERVWQESQ